MSNSIPALKGPLQFAGAFVLLIALLPVLSKAPEFKVFEMGKWGGGLGQTSFADVDKDGDMDFISGSKGGPMRWWEYQSADKWVQRVMWDGEKLCHTSGVSLDVDGDGWVDQVSGYSWLKNPGEAGLKGDQEWKQHRVVSKCYWADAMVGDINGDGKLDVAGMYHEACAWYDIPDDPTQTWTEHQFFPKGKWHSGMAMGDIDGDGDMDVSIHNPNWLENVSGDGTKWKEHKVPFSGKIGSGTMVEMADIDDDGDIDMLMTNHWDGSQVQSWLENTDGKGNFTEHVLRKGLHRGHAVNIIDYDNDGDLDLISGDAEGKGGECWFYENLGKEFKGVEKFKEHKHPERYPTHDMRAADVDGDGDLDLASKPWSSGNLHVFWKNLHVENGGNPMNWERAPMGSHNYLNPNRPKKLGCTDPKDPNFDFWATDDNGTCQKGKVAIAQKGLMNYDLQMKMENGKIILSLSDKNTRVLQLTNARGKAFPVQRVSGNYQVSANNLRTGAYWVALETAGTSNFQKIMVMPGR